MSSKSLSLFLILLSFCACEQEAPNQLSLKMKPTAFEDAPDWAKEVIWYEIGVERFRNGDTSNDQTEEDIQGAYPGFVPAGWQITPWTQDWYAPDAYHANFGNRKDFYGNTVTRFTDRVQIRRYGGDLQGVLDKVDYLDSLGITAVYFRPLNDAPSLHKYDARNWRHIDRNFGPDPTKDKATIAAEIPDDPTTWQMTEADKMFLQVIKIFHERGIKLILDYSWNHTGITHWAWQDVLKNQAQSKFKDWYWVKNFDDPATEANEFDYHGWLGVHSLPEFRETEKQDLTKGVYSFEGNLYAEAAKNHIFSIAERWLDPNGDGDPSDGVDGYRLDVAGEMPLGFWRDFRKHVRSINPDAYLMGEIWWEEWPDKLLDPQPFVKGDVFDAVMNYRWYRAVRHFFNASPDKITVSELQDSLLNFSANLREGTNYAMMNYTGGFDTPRLLTSLFNKNKYKYQCRVYDDPDYKIHKPDRTTLQTSKLLLAQQFTYIGAPHIYAGDEMGMWGADDPSCRKPLIWQDYTFDDEKMHPLGKEKSIDEVKFNTEQFDYYRKLITLRKQNPVLVHGQIEFIPIDEETLVYKRFDKQEEIIAVFNASENAKRIAVPVKTKGTYQDLLSGIKTKHEAGKIVLQIPGRTPAVLKKSN